MDPDELKKLAESALAPYIETIQHEREQARFWYENSMTIQKQYMELLEVNQKLRDENRQLYMKMLGIKD